MAEEGPREPPETGTPLYVHVPFCVAKCTYCDFFSVEEAGQDLPGTVDLLLAEAERRAPRRPRTVFLGGGTPSLLSAGELERLLRGLDRITNFRASAREVTLECNPESLDEEKARLLLRLGVDRLSIGVQSLEPRILELFGRVHTSEQSFEAFRAARRAGFQRLSVDLIYAAPGQELAAWEADLERVLDLAPDHVSAYALAYEKGTMMTRWEKEGAVEAQGEEASLAFFQATRRRLGERGYEAYEVSNFSLSGQQCLHNVGYWRNEPYSGIGPSAVSQLEGTRFGNHRSIDAWSRDVAAGRSARGWTETLTPTERLGETWWLGLRTREGVDPVRAREVSGLPREAALDPAEALAGELEPHGLLVRRGRAWRLSERGLPVADEVARRFLEACREGVGVDGARSGDPGR